MHDTLCSIEGVARVRRIDGAEADREAVADLLFEVPHGATRAAHFTTLRERLRGDVPADLIEFFFVNTDVGAPELATAIAERVVAEAPSWSVIVVTSELPRTLIDCNRVLDADAVPRGGEAGRLTPGLPPWIREPADQRLLLRLHAAYVELAQRAHDVVCGAGGHALLVHSYAPRSLDVAVDERIVARLHEAYSPERIGSYPLRAEVDLITEDPDGRLLGPPELAARVVAELRSTGRQVATNGVYTLHPASQAHRFAARHPGRCLCFEVRRDLLVGEFVPFRELAADPALVAALAEPFARAVLAE